MKLTLGVDSVFEGRLEEMKWFLAFALLDELFEIMGVSRVQDHGFYMD